MHDCLAPHYRSEAKSFVQSNNPGVLFKGVEAKFT